MQAIAWNNSLWIIFLAKQKASLIEADEDKNSYLKSW